MDERQVRTGQYSSTGPVHEMKQPWRTLNAFLVRRTFRRHQVEGLRGIDRSGRPVWEPGYPKAPGGD